MSIAYKNLFEEWMPIIGFEESYEISNQGRVKSLERTIIKKDGTPNPYKEVIMAVTITNAGYYSVRLSKEGRKKTKAVHILVAESFMNHNKKGELVVNHKDFNRLNNHVNNFEIITQRKNADQKHIQTSSIYTGVNWDKRKNKWRTRIYHNGKRIHLGMFANQNDAGKAYDDYVKQHNLN